MLVFYSKSTLYLFIIYWDGFDVFSKSKIFRKKFLHNCLVMLFLYHVTLGKKIFSVFLHISSFVIVWVNHGPIVKGLSLLG